MEAQSLGSSIQRVGFVIDRVWALRVRMQMSPIADLSSKWITLGQPTTHPERAEQPAFFSRLISEAVELRGVSTILAASLRDPESSAGAD